MTVPREQLLRNLAEYQLILDERPDDARALLKVGDLHLRADEPIEAVPFYRRAAEAFAKDGQHLKALAVGEHVLHVIQERATEKAATIPDVVLLLATSYLALGRGEEATKIVEEGAETLEKLGLSAEITELRRRAGELPPPAPRSGPSRAPEE